MLVIIAIIIAALVIFYFFKNNTDKDDIKGSQFAQAMKNDTFGGKIPEETLDLFIEALKNDDIELASQYFILNQDMTRGTWLGALNIIKENKLLDEMVADLENKTGPVSDNIENSDVFRFTISDDKTMITTITLRLNKFSGVWKIESL